MSTEPQIRPQNRTKYGRGLSPFLSPSQCPRRAFVSLLPSSRALLFPSPYSRSYRKTKETSAEERDLGLNGIIFLVEKAWIFSPAWTYNYTLRGSQISSYPFYFQTTCLKCLFTFDILPMEILGKKKINEISTWFTFEHRWKRRIKMPL